MKDHKVVVRNLWRKVRLEATKQAVGRANGKSFVQAKVLKEHAVPQDLCANLIGALKLLANQQEDGDGLLQNIVTNFGEGSRKGLTDGLRDFVRVDNERALDDGAPGTVKVRKPEFREGSSDVTVRESLDVLTLRAEEVVTSKAYIDVNHIEPEKWGPPLVDADWHAFCQALSGSWFSLEPASQSNH